MDVTDTPLSTEDSSSQNTAAQPFRKVPVTFSGEAGQFFGIWIVNILLTIVTLGIYSAWAKVRTQQYFYGNTSIEGHSFSYLAQPLQILKGRVLAVILFGGYSLASHFYPLVGLGILAVLLFLFPWILNQSLRFNLRMSSYRNVRFSFKGSYGEAFIYWILLPIASVFTLYLMLPWALKKADQYVFNNISYGDKPFITELKTGEYYETSLWVFLTSLGLMVGMFIVMLLLGGVGAAADLDFQSNKSSLTTLMIVGSGVFYVFMISVLSAIYRGRIRNHILQNTEIEGIAQLRSDVKIIPFAKLMFVNIVAIIFTAGLAYPWVKVRTAKFLSQATGVLIDNNADSVLDNMTQSQSAFGEEAAEVFDIDIALT